MGYNVYITRAEAWSQNDGHEISREEWLQYVAAADGLKLDGPPGDSLALATWSGHPEACFYWSDGNIVAKNPDPTTVEKMVSMAEGLYARVQGDDGETYPGGVVPGRPKPARKPFLAGLFRPKPKAPFKAGDRVWCDIRRQECTVVSINPRDQGGVLDTVTIRYDDGTHLKQMLSACSLRPIHP